MNMYELRGRLEPHFAQDTAVPDTNSKFPSAGHCAAVAYIAYQLDPSRRKLVSTSTAFGVSHWFVREGEYDWDITVDQFPGWHHNMVARAKAGQLYGGTRVRDVSEVNEETRARARLLAKRAGIELCKHWDTVRVPEYDLSPSEGGEASRCLECGKIVR